MLPKTDVKLLQTIVANIEPERRSVKILQIQSHHVLRRMKFKPKCAKKNLHWIYQEKQKHPLNVVVNIGKIYDGP